MRTVPYGSYDDVIKLTRNAKGEQKIYWYAKDVGMIKEYNIKKNKIAELINITGGPSRPLD